MSIPGSASPLFFKEAAAAAAAPAGVATRSLRFNSADTAYLSRTPSSAGDRRTWTVSFWIKKVKNDSSANFYRIFGQAEATHVYFYQDNINFDISTTGSAIGRRWTNHVFRDNSAWFHCVCVCDTTASTASERMRMYINGSEVTSFSATTDPSQNVETSMNTTNIHTIGYRTSAQNSAGGALNAYLADFYFIDGSALDATSFGAFDDNGVWQAAAYSGTYGTNGFHLGFGDNSSNAALGTDSSGNSNTFTVHNITANNTGSSGGFQAVTWTGNGGTQAITTTGMSPDLVWIKNRNGAHNHMLFDIVRGAGADLQANSTATEGAAGSNDLTSFDSSGFSLGSNNAVNQSSRTYVAWCWKANGTASSNTDGTITSSVSASTEYGFSVVTFTGPGSAGFASVGHGLGQKPKFIICKDRDNSRNWSVFHEDVVTSDTDILSLNQDIATFTSGTAAWDVSAIDSSTFTPYFRDDFGASYGADNVAYCWAEKSGFSKFGTYTGNGNTSGSGPRVELGFKPAFLMVKGFNVQSGWRIFDATRDTGGQFQKRLYANESGAESTNSTQYVDYDDTGFDVEASGSLSTYNVSGKTYIYMAFAKDPGGDVVDSLLDVPTNGTQTDTGAGGEVSGNYATWSPLVAQTSGSITLSNGNLDTTCGTTRTTAMSSFPLTGKTYWEITFGSGTYNYIGMTEATGFNTVANNNSGIKYTGYKDYSYGWGQSDGNLYKASNILSSSPGQYSNGDVVGWAYDADNNTLKLYKNGSLVHTENNIADAQYFPAITHSGTATASTNFGQRPFAYAAPSGYKPVSTATSLPTPTVADGSDYFDQLKYVGNQTARSITGLSFSPDLVIVKNRERSAYNHYWVDNVRGGGKNLYSNSNEAEHVADRITTLDSAGFTLSSHMGPNYSGENYIAHCWDAGSSTSSNTDGSITTSLRVNATAGFAVAAYTGNQTSGATIGHGLSAKPAFWLLKSRSGSDMWIARHTGFANTHYLEFNDTYAIRNAISDVTGDSDPTNTVIPVGAADTNNNGKNYIAYIWAPVAGFSAAPSWTGNGSSDGTFIPLDFKPKAFWFKRTDSASNFYVYDTTRSTRNPVNKNLEWNTADAENTLTSMNVDFLSNGIKIRGSDGDINGSGGSYIGFAWAENPFQANGGLAR